LFGTFSFLTFFSVSSRLEVSSATRAGSNCRFPDPASPKGFVPGKVAVRPTKKNVIRNGKLVVIMTSRKVCVKSAEVSPNQTPTTQTAATVVTSVPPKVAVGPVTPLIAGGRVLYVSPQGADSQPGTILLPRKNPPKLQNGDTIVFRDGLHSKISFDLTSLRDIRLMAYPGETPILDGELEKAHFLIHGRGIDHYEIRRLVRQRSGDRNREHPRCADHPKHFLPQWFRHPFRSPHLHGWSLGSRSIESVANKGESLR
jgi:hypothetical protein